MFFKAQQIIIICVGVGVLVAMTVAVYMLYLSYSTDMSKNADINNEARPETARIENVPYHGIFTGSLTASPNTAVAVTLLEYYGDARLDVYGVEAVFDDNNTLDGDFPLEDFFRQQGYLVSEFPLEHLDTIKDYIIDGHPVVALQRFSKETPPELHTARVVVGYSDSNETFEVHDVHKGSHRNISYDDFRILGVGAPNFGFVLDPSTVAEVALTPSKEASSTQPLIIMDDPDVAEVILAWTKAAYYTAEAERQFAAGASEEDVVTTYETAVAEWRKAIESPGFQKMRPADRYRMAFELGRIYTSQLNMQNEAIEIFRDVMIPLGEAYVFTEPYGEWTLSDPKIFEDRWWEYAGWMGLAIASVRNDDLDTAREAFTKVRDIDPEHEDALLFFEGDLSFAEL